MKTSDEIRAKISELMFDVLPTIRHDPEQHEAVCNQIDALLWVIGDRSGKPI